MFHEVVWITCQSDVRSRTLDRESPVNSCGHVVEACRVSPAPCVFPSHLWPCDLHNLSRTPYDRPWDTHLADTIRRVRQTDSRQKFPEDGKRRTPLGLVVAGSTCSPRLAPIELVLLGSRLLDQPIPRSRCSLAGSLPLHEESATTTRIGWARALIRILVREKEREVSPPTDRR